MALFNYIRTPSVFDYCRKYDPEKIPVQLQPLIMEKSLHGPEQEKI